VVIVGAGPTGLALAAELRRLGVDPVIVDRQAAGANTSRAAVVHARTLEVLEPLGVTDALIAQGIKVPIFRVRDRDRALVTIDFSGIPSVYDFTLMCPQDRTERILLHRLEQLGGGVTRPRTFVGFAEGDGFIDVRLKDGDAFDTVRTRWLVGCDGMHSGVREQSGIPFTGAPYAQSFVLADVHMDWPLDREEVSLFLSPEGLVVVAPLPEGRFRIVATVNDAPDTPSIAFMQALLDARGPQTTRGRVRDAVWSSRFHVHHRVANSPRKGRVLLCGDAAHVHSPAGGQGMNTGIQDAVSLARCVTQVLNDGDDGRLDGWARERHRIAREVVRLTDRMTKLATMKSAAGQALRNAAISCSGHFPPVTTRVATTLAELTHR
jgi:2-polyprenyl-6-methoxyphenol hydroxylase-like FAD-dependent oxidoreductase